MRVAPATAVTMNRQFEMPTGGTAPMSTSRRMPPPRPAAQPSTRMPNTSNCLRTAARAPDIAPTKTPMSSSTGSRGMSVSTRAIMAASRGHPAHLRGAPFRGAPTRVRAVAADRWQARAELPGGRMGELELVGLHEDGEHLVLVAPDGARFRLRIDEPLRAAVRRDRPQLEQLRAESAGTLSPREIQARIRAGATTQEVADDAGLPIERVRRYEGPVLAEREHIAEQARGTRVGRDVGAPTLGDLVTDRLAARGVDLASLAWDAARDASGPWVVLARFAVGDTQHEARWTFDPAKRTVVADEDEARWLSETEIADEPVSRRHLAAVRDVVFDFQGGDGPTLRADDAAVEAVEPTPDPHEQTASLLDDLRSRRGVRQAVELGDEDDDTEAFE